MILRVVTASELDSSNNKYTSGGSSFLRINHMAKLRVIENEPERQDVSIEEFKSKTQLRGSNNQASFRAINGASQEETRQNFERAASRSYLERYLDKSR